MQLCLAPKVQKRGAPLQDERETLDARKCGELVGVAWTSLKSMGKTRWWSFFTMFESFMLNIKTLRYQRDSPHSDLVAPEVYNLSDLDWAEIVMVFKLAQETLEGELYITGSRVVDILDKIRADLILTRLSGRIQRRELAC